MTAKTLLAMFVLIFAMPRLFPQFTALRGLKLDLMRLYCSGPMEAKTLMTVILLQGLKRHLCLQVNDFFSQEEYYSLHSNN
uniref:Uncharacterized protein n=1 Tax=Myoviridae sp. ctdyF5 TaxID=2825144 RepID=A0A8S5U7I6_9CAUD|nr:MAG TPA: hypothetical protein [Myoviridae sp. ctdyF5]